jgi:DNA topoisomerase IB
MPRLRRVDCSTPGITRRRRGRGFAYLDEYGERLQDEEAFARIHELAIPPAWRDVWICTDANGHLQATGIDAAGRKQYIYHPRWRARRDQQKFDDMVAFARVLPRMREVVDAHLAGEELDRNRVLAAATRLLDRGFFRIGGEGYAEANGSYGLATIRKEHVTIGKDGTILFDYPAKSGQRRVQAIVDPEVLPVVQQLKRRRGGSAELLAYREGGRWRDVRSDDINEYVRDVTGHPCSAKDFRTWNATVLAALALAVAAPTTTASPTARKRAMTRATKEVAHYLGNTPAVCRASYIDPRVFDRFQSGWTIAGVLPELGDLFDADVRATVEEAVLDLLEDRREADAVVQGLPVAA